MPDDNRTNKAPSDREMARLRRAKESALPRLLRIPGVHSVGIGYKHVGGKTTDQLAVLVFVDEKLPRSKVQADWFVPAEVRFHWETSDREEAVPTDIIARLGHLVHGGQPPNTRRVA